MLKTNQIYIALRVMEWNQSKDKQEVVTYYLWSNV